MCPGYLHKGWVEGSSCRNRRGSEGSRQGQESGSEEVGSAWPHGGPGGQIAPQSSMLKREGQSFIFPLSGSHRLQAILGGGHSPSILR